MLLLAAHPKRKKEALEPSRHVSKNKVWLDSIITDLRLFQTCKSCTLYSTRILITLLKIKDPCLREGQP